MANPFQDSTLGAMLDAVAARYPTREAIVFSDQRLTFADLRAAAERLASGLRALGIGRDDKVAVWLPNRPTSYVAQYACAKIGAVLVALNPRYRSHELSYILGQSDSVALLLTDRLGPTNFLETLADVLPGLPQATPGESFAEGFPQLRWVIVDADERYPGTVRLSDVLAAAAERPAAAAGPDDVCTILYTSGTTSFPKGAMIAHRNCLPHGWNCGEILRMTPEDRVLHALPPSGTWGGLAIPLMTWTHGGCLVLMDVWDPLRALSLIEKERCTVWNGVDTMIISLLDCPDLDRYSRASLRTGGFAMTGGGRHGLFEDVVERIGVPLAYQPYGMTEVNAVAMLHDLDESVAERARPGWIPAPGLEVRVVDPESGAPRAPGEAGELQMRGQLVSRGYYRKPDETRAALTDDGWFKSGDLCVQDEAGHTIFTGRMREVLRISHFMVAPSEIEAFLMSHPKVQQAFVVGVPDRKMTEAAAAYVIARDGEILTEEDVLGHCRGRIASYKIPRYVRIVKDVPRTPGPHGDKPQKQKLREQAIRELGLKE